MSGAPCSNVLKNVFSIIVLGLVLEFIYRFQALRDRILGGIVYPGAKEGLPFKSFLNLGLKAIKVCYVWGKYDATTNPLVAQSAIWDPKMHFFVVTKDNLASGWCEVAYTG